VKCKYSDIGCKRKLHRRDTEETHQGMKQASCTMKEEISVLKKENSSLKKASAKFKQEKETLTNKLLELETKSNAEVFHLKLKVKNLTKDLKEFKQENLKKLIEKTRNSDIIVSNEVVQANNEAVCMKLNDGVNNIVNLKRRLSQTPSLYEKVSLVNNDNVMMIRGIKIMGFREFSKCYKRNDFNKIFDKFGLNDHKNIMMELLNKVSYHLYDNKLPGDQCYSFVFPLDLKNIKDIELLLPDMFKMIILKDEIMVETLDQRIRYIYLFIGKYRAQLQSGEKFHFEQVFHRQLSNGWSFTCGYACLFLSK